MLCRPKRVMNRPPSPPPEQAKSDERKHRDARFPGAKTTYDEEEEEQRHHRHDHQLHDAPGGQSPSPSLARGIDAVGSRTRLRVSHVQRR